jgi:DHA2 family multidrug resistance protein-like MFS transporter
MSPTSPPRATRRDWIGLAVLALPCMLYAMDLTVLNLALPHLTAALHPTAPQLLWIVDIYGFFVAGSLITMGTLGDRIGRRRLLMFGASLFGAVSVLAAFAPSAELLIVARAAMGISAATIAPSTLSLISNMFLDPKQRTVAVGVWVASFSAGGALGPMLGGLLLEYFWWGSVFLLAAPVMLLLRVLGPRVLPEFRDPEPAAIDVRSAALSIAAVLLGIYGVKLIAAEGPSVTAAVFVAAGLALGAVFVHRQRGLAHPLVDLALFRVRPFVICLTIYTLGAFAAFGTFLTIAQYLQLVLGMGPLAAGLWTAPSGVIFIAGSILSPRLTRLMRPRYVMVAGLALGVAGALLLTQVGGERSLAVLMVGYLVFSLGMSLTFTLAVDLVVSSAPPERAGGASALAETGAELGGAVGIAMLGSILTFVYRAVIEVPAGAPAEASQTLGGAVAAAAQLPGGVAAELLGAARAAYSDAMSVTAAICALALVAATLAVAFLIPDAPVSDAASTATGDEAPPATVMS